MSTIRLIDMSPLDGAEVEVTSLPPTAEHAGRPFVRLGFAPETLDAGGKTVWGSAVLYVWRPLIEWMRR